MLELDDITPKTASVLASADLVQDDLSRSVQASARALVKEGAGALLFFTKRENGETLWISAAGQGVLVAPSGEWRLVA